MLSIEHCRKTLEKNGKKGLTNQQVEEIRKTLYLFADIQLHHSHIKKDHKSEAQEKNKETCTNTPKRRNS
jgi:hypothetical protein